MTPNQKLSVGFCCWQIGPSAVAGGRLIISIPVSTEGYHCQSTTGVPNSGCSKGRYFIQQKHLNCGTAWLRHSMAVRRLWGKAPICSILARQLCSPQLQGCSSALLWRGSSTPTLCGDSFRVRASDRETESSMETERHSPSQRKLTYIKKVPCLPSLIGLSSDK